MITIKLSGQGRLFALFKKIEGVAWMTPPMKRTSEDVLADLRRYPPPRSSKYVRTYKLQEGWKLKLSQSGGHRVSAVVDNAQPYAPYVQAEEFQSHIHRGHWRTEMEILESHESTIVQAFGEAMQSAWSFF